MLAVGLMCFVLLLWGANFCFSYSLDPEERGPFGDMFGAVNSLFTGLAFGAVIYAIFLQRHEISLLKEELDRNGNLWREQQAAAEGQLRLQNKQQFETTFFNLLRIFGDLVESIDLRSKGAVTAQGKDVFPIFLKRIRSQESFRADGWYDSMPRKIWAEDVYADFYNNNHKSELGHYFRTLFNLYKFVDRSDVEDKKFYTNLIRAQLSNDETMLLFLNGLSSEGEKFREYLERYSVLKNVDKDDALYRHAKGKDIYSPSAFGDAA